MNCNCIAIDGNVLSRIIAAVRKELGDTGTKSSEAGESCCDSDSKSACCTINVCISTDSDCCQTKDGES